MTRVEIDLTAQGEGVVKLDGASVAAGLQGLTLNANVGETPTVILRIGGRAAAQAEAGVRVVVPDALRAALVAGGWTPPGEGGPLEQDVTTYADMQRGVRVHLRHDGSRREEPLLPSGVEHETPAGARPASRRSNRAAGIVLLVIVISLALCAGVGALLGGPPNG